jgi:hypothetical protein
MACGSLLWWKNWVFSCIDCVVSGGLHVLSISPYLWKTKNSAKKICEFFFVLKVNSRLEFAEICSPRFPRRLTRVGRPLSNAFTMRHEQLRGCTSGLHIHLWRVLPSTAAPVLEKQSFKRILVGGVRVQGIPSVVAFIRNLEEHLERSIFDEACAYFQINPV